MPGLIDGTAGLTFGQGLSWARGMAGGQGLQNLTVLPQTLAIYNAMTVKPSLARLLLMDTLVRGLVVTYPTLWTKSRGFYVMAAHASQAGRVNWKTPGTNDLTAVNNPSFTVDRGFTGDGSSSYLDSGLTFVGFQDDGALAMWSRTAAQVSGADCGNGNSIIGARNGSNQTTYRINAASSSTPPGNDGSGFFVASRTASNAQAIYRNGTSVSTSTAASSTPDASAIRFCGRSGTVQYSTREEAFGGVFTGLNATEVGNLNTLLTSFLTAIGAA